MTRNHRLLDLTLLLSLLSVVAMHPAPPQPQTPSPCPPTSVPSAPTSTPQSGRWQDSALHLHLQKLPGWVPARQSRFQLTLRNDSDSSCWIPGTFCQEGEEPDWWSHGVRLRVSPTGRVPQPGWRLGPTYGERDLHEHDSFPMLIPAHQTLQWQFTLAELNQGSDGEPVRTDWESAQGPFQVQAELTQSGHQVLSNPVTVEGKA